MPAKVDSLAFDVLPLEEVVRTSQELSKKLDCTLTHGIDIARLVSWPSGFLPSSM